MASPSTVAAPPRPYCYRCFKAASVCVCPTLARVANRTRIHILQHPRERHFPIGTVRFAELGLTACEVEVNRPWSGEPSRLSAQPPPGAALLFPSPTARAVETLPASQRPSTLVVLDGTWHQVKALLKNNEWLQALPHLYLAEPTPSGYRIRAEPQVHYLSTLEAIVATLRHLEPDTAGFDALLQAFAGMIDTQVLRSAARQVRRRPSRNRAPHPHPSQALLPADPRHVLVYVETVGARSALRPIQVSAWRLATGDRLECLIAHGQATDAAKLAHLGLTPPTFASAMTEAEFRNRWEDFVRADDVLVAWSQRTLDVLASPLRSVMVKALWCNLQRRQAGPLSQVVANLGLQGAATGFAGRTDAHLGELRALVAWLAVPGNAADQRSVGVTPPNCST